MPRGGAAAVWTADDLPNLVETDPWEELWVEGSVFIEEVEGVGSVLTVDAAPSARGPHSG